MSQDASFSPAEFVTRVVAAAQEMRGNLPCSLVERFSVLLLRNLPDDTLSGRRPTEMAMAALSLLGQLECRKPGQAKVVCYSPSTWEGEGCTVVEIVNDDMPFLVNSVLAELKTLGRGLRRMAHPILDVERGKDGRLQDIPHQPSSGTIRESAVYMELEGRSDAETCADIKERLLSVLADVRAAATDWPLMAERLGQLRASLAAKAAGEFEEEAELTGWLADGHFSFLGAYTLECDEGGGWGIVPSSLSGICRGIAGGRAKLSDVLIGTDKQGVLSVFKATVRSRSEGVERSILLDLVAIKGFGQSGDTISIDVFLGVFSSSALSSRLAGVPVLRRKMAEIFRLAGFRSDSHDGRTLAHVLETFPREELFQLDAQTIADTAKRVVAVQDIPAVAAFSRLDQNGHFAACVAYVPQDRCDGNFLRAARAALEQAFGGNVCWQTVRVSDSQLARLYFLLEGDRLRHPSADTLRGIIESLTRTWDERLLQALLAEPDNNRRTALAARYANAFPPVYRHNRDVSVAIEDISRIERLDGRDAHSFTIRNFDGQTGGMTLCVHSRGVPVPLSKLLSLLENFGIEVVTHTPYHLHCDQGADAWHAWINEFDTLASSSNTDVSCLEAALSAAWRGEAENDQLNRLVTGAGLSWREVALLRTYGRYLRQVDPIGQHSVERILADHPKPACLLVSLFGALLCPDKADDDVAIALRTKLLQTLDRDVQGAEEERILRRFLDMIAATVRTNFYQTGAQGDPKPRLALKLDSRSLNWLPHPRPFAEIFVYTPQMEAVHLRGGRVARGGIRWSDRRDDFRTEVLSLVKAQMVKNSVIVPAGAKGGFVVKAQPRPDQSPQELGTECYRTMIRGILDVTDNVVDGLCVPPARVVRRDGEDPYLVVAADKGTATFSDIANAIACDEYGFWLGDAFASGGSHGYDHKKMGITARGAWESVRRHFRGMGHDVDTQPFTVAGVGDMSGDVFGNGMLLSRQIRLIAAFDHRHIFVDPDPDPELSFQERSRLFHLSGSSWDHYDKTKLSAGGGIYARGAKLVDLKPEAAARLGLDSPQVTPTELIQAILCAQVDLLWFGGIGTYVKSSAQSHLEANDRINDVVRVNGTALRARVVGEGANLAFTQAGRVEYAHHGGKINTDAIDNSAGVDTSDHEVNIKILLSDAVAAATLPADGRDRLLESLTDQVAAKVLRDNALQHCALTAAEGLAASQPGLFIRAISFLEANAGLDRQLEGLPSDTDILALAARGQSLTRPELAVVMAYAKNWLTQQLVSSQEFTALHSPGNIADYFPESLQAPFSTSIGTHRLNREIGATLLANCIVNHAGMTFMTEMVDRHGTEPMAVVRAYVQVTRHFGADKVLAALDSHEPNMDPAMFLDASARLRMFIRLTCADLIQAPVPTGLLGLLEQAVGHLRGEHTQTAPLGGLDSLEACMAAAELVRLAEDSQIPLDHAARVHSVVESSLGLGELRRLASVEPIGTALQELARSSLAETLGDLQRRVAWRLAVMIQPDDAPSNLEQVLLRSDDVLSQLREIKAQVQAGSAGLLESLAVATRLTGILLKRLPEAPPRLAAE